MNSASAGPTNLVNKMTEDSRQIAVENFVEFLAPLIDVLTCDQISLTKLARNHKDIIAKLNQTGRPVLLTTDGQTLLLCDAQLYFGLETRRQRVLSRFKRVEDALQVAEVDVEDPRIIELQTLQYQSASLQAEIKDSSWRVEEAKKELAAAHAGVAALTADLKRAEV